MEAKDEIKQRLDIADVISGYLTIKPAGSGSFKAVCPFHSEKTPSFHISRERQIWHCFGCNKGGDVISFVMDMEGMDFPEALRLLGAKAGVVVPEFSPSRTSNEEQSLRDLNELACKYFEKFLLEHAEGEKARAYLKERQITPELAREFRLGATPDRWDSLVTFLTSRGFSLDRLAKAGLVKSRSTGTGMIDRFRNRLMIPLCDYTGRVVGFTGRYLGEIDDKSGPKYLNSPETAIYKKSDQLYGLHLAKTAIRHQGSVIIMEGNLDVIASHKAGVQNVIASSGTALTESQLRQLKKLTSRLIFCFDGDSAGFAAAKRGIHLAQNLDFAIQVIAIPPELGKDPDDVVRKNPAEWVKLAASPINIIDYYFRQSIARFNPQRVEDKRELAKFLIEEIARLRDPVEREHWLQRLSDVIHASLDTLKQMVVDQQHASTASNPPSPAPANRQVPSGNGGIVAPRPAVPVPAPAGNDYFKTNIDRASAFVLGILLTQPDLAGELVARVAPERLADGYRALYKRAVLDYTNAQTATSTPQNIFSLLSHELVKNGSTDEINRLNACAIWIERLTESLKPETVRDELRRHIELLDALGREAQRQELEGAIRQAESVGDLDRLRVLMDQYSKLLKS